MRYFVIQTEIFIKVNNLIAKLDRFSEKTCILLKVIQYVIRM